MSGWAPNGLGEGCVHCEWLFSIGQCAWELVARL